MNRAGFFKVIGGAVAAIAGFKPVVKAKGLFNFKCSVIPGAVANPDDFQWGARLLHAYTYENKNKPLTRLQKAIQEESARMQKNLPHIIEEEHDKMMGALGYDTDPTKEIFKELHAKNAGYVPQEPNKYIKNLMSDENKL